MTGDERVAVVGGGVIGCAVARALAPEYEVDVFEADRIGSGATGLAAGDISTLSYYADEPDIGWHAVEFFREFDGTGEFEFFESRSVRYVLPEKEDLLRRQADRLSSDRDLPIRYLSRERASERYPRIDLSDFVGIVEFDTVGYVDPYTLTTTLQSEAADHGARFRTNTPVEDVAVVDDRIDGVETADEYHEADYAVAATGWRTRAFLRDHLEVPVRPYRTQCVVLEPNEPLTPDFAIGWYPEEHVYYRPEQNGDLLMGGWSFPTDDPATASTDEDEEFRLHVAELVPELFEGFDDADFVDGWAGVDAATPDTRPIIDAPPDAPDGLIVATGFHGRGIMTSPVAATAVRSLISGAAAPFSIEPFALDRFESRSDDFEFTSISSE